MVWSFLKKLPNVQSAMFIRDEIQEHKRKNDLREHWPKCLAVSDGDVEKAKDMLARIVCKKPEWIEVVRTYGIPGSEQFGLDPEKARGLRIHIGALLRSTSLSSSLPPAPTAPAAPTSDKMASLSIESSVPGADIEIDGAFVGNTPSTVAVANGSHQIAVKKKGFTDWTKTLSVTGGTVHLSAELEQEQPKQ
jgi:hypothetical protein